MFTNKQMKILTMLHLLAKRADKLDVKAGRTKGDATRERLYDQIDKLEAKAFSGTKKIVLEWLKANI
jgi:hypothetical protein